MALTADRNTQRREGKLFPVPMAANAVIYAGALVVANSSGYAAPGSVATTHTYLGRSEQSISNDGGANGDKEILVSRGPFKWKNSGSDPVTQASFGKVCYIVDDETVAATDGTATRSVAGVVTGIDSDGVWVG